jgi:uncharacterized protein (TIGR02217 family)
MFYPIQIQQIPGLGFVGGPEFSTNVKALQSGREKRNADWSVCRHKYTCPFKNISGAAYLAIKEVFLVCRGQLHTFLHRDWGDFNASNASFGTGDGVTTVFQLSKISNVGIATYTRIITKPDVDAAVMVAGVAASPEIDAATGLVTFAAPPALGAALTWSGTFYVQVRFDVDSLPFSLDDINPGGYVTNGSLDLIEVLDE